jgi:hypothetical protein
LKKLQGIIKKPSSTKTKPLDLLHPGMSINLVVNTDMIREINDIRTSILHEIIGKKLVMAQTDPVLLKTQINKTLMVSFLSEDTENPVRYGFQAKIIDFINEYPLSSSQRVPAIVVISKTVPKRYNLRMFYRIQPPSSYGLQIAINDQPMGIIDISIGGAIISATLSQDREMKFETGKTIKIKLSLDDHNFNLEAQIKRISFRDDQKWSRELVFVALQFYERTLDLDRLLGGKIIDIQKELHSKGLEP